MIFKLSSDFLMETFTLVDNKFIIEYVPYAEDLQIRVYLYGLYQCANPAADSALDEITRVFNITEEDVKNIFSYWQEQGLVKIVSESPLEIRYLSLKRGNQPPKKFKAEKYSDFNLQLQALFPDRQILPNEYNEYYMFLEIYKMEQNALLMVVQYCIDFKGPSVRYPYILAVARDWANNGVKTVADVEAKLEEYDAQTELMRDVLRALNRKGGADLEEKQMLLKWTKSWGFSPDAVAAAAKRLKNKTFKRLDAQLDEYFKKNIFTAQEMKNYEDYVSSMRELAMAVNAKIGVFYESLDNVVETYIIPWTNKGFDADSLLKIAHYCFLSGIKTLKGLNSRVNFFFKEGCITKESIDQYIALQLENDETIEKIIEATGRVRHVTSNDRECYKLWSATWGFSDDIIIFAASCCAQKPYPMPAINQLLDGWHKSGIATLEKAKAAVSSTVPAQGKTDKKPFMTREYTKQEIASMFADNDIFEDDAEESADE